jgi:hypothetical protein
VAYSLSIIYAWARSRGGWILKTMVLCSIIPYILFFYSIYPAATKVRDYLADGANYGVFAIPKVAESIKMETLRHNKDSYKVLIHYQAGKKWKNNIAWSKLHLQRLLNFDMDLNILSKQGEVKRKISMPKGELTNFKNILGRPGVYVSEREKDLDDVEFDIVYLAYLQGETPLDIIDTQFQRYEITSEKIHYPRKPHYQAFNIYQYLPVN